MHLGLWLDGHCHVLPLIPSNLFSYSPLTFLIANSLMDNFKWWRISYIPCLPLKHALINYMILRNGGRALLSEGWILTLVNILPWIRGFFPLLLSLIVSHITKANLGKHTHSKISHYPEVADLIEQMKSLGKWVERGTSQNVTPEFIVHPRHFVVGEK